MAAMENILVWADRVLLPVIKTDRQVPSNLPFINLNVLPFVTLKCNTDLICVFAYKHFMHKHPKQLVNLMPIHFVAKRFHDTSHTQITTLCSEKYVTILFKKSGPFIDKCIEEKGYQGRDPETVSHLNLPLKINLHQF